MTDSPDLKRRTLIKGMATSSLLPLLGSNLIACSGGSGGSDNSIAGVLDDTDDSVAANFAGRLIASARTAARIGASSPWIFTNSFAERYMSR